MKNKIITTIVSIVLIIIPVLIIPNSENNYNLLKIIMLLLCGVALFVMLVIKRKQLKFDINDIFIFIFGIMAIISTIFSLNVKKSIIGESNRYEGLLTIITYILIYYSSKYHFKNNKKITKIVMGVYMAICLVAIIQFYMPSNITLLPILGKGAHGTFGNTNFMGSFISIILPIFILKYIFTNEKKYLICGTISFSVMLMCIARSSWVAFGVYSIIIVIYLIINKNKDYWKRYAILIIVFIICFNVIYFTGGLLSGKINIMFNEIENIKENGLTDGVGSSRIEVWKLSSKVLCKFPVLGCGVDALKDGLETVCPYENMMFTYTHRGHIDKAHNEYLQIAVTMGIPALAIYLGALCLILLPNIRKALKEKESMILSVAIISYLAQAFFNISTIGIAPLFWFMLGIAARNIKEEKLMK